MLHQAFTVNITAWAMLCPLLKWHNLTFYCVCLFQLKCCGVEGSEDYKGNPNIDDAYPDSCCQNKVENDEGDMVCDPNNKEPFPDVSISTRHKVKMQYVHFRLHANYFSFTLEDSWRN